MPTRYDRLKKVGKRLETPTLPKFTEKNIGTYKIITVTKGQRLDNISYSVYGDSSLWWILASVNDLKLPFISDNTFNLMVPDNPNIIMNLFQ